jgi:hypothetical protein
MNHHTESINTPTNVATRFVNSENVSRTISMTSLELVDFINLAREEGQPELRHDHFMAKVPRVIGKAAPNFLGTDSYANGSGGKVSRRIYTFPKREACLMAMSYSYELQAAVFDYMTDLEARIAQPVALPSYAETLRLYADQIEHTQRVTHERDHAIATKAEIGSRREATAMATASAAVRQAQKLKSELGLGTTQASVVAVEKITGRKFGISGYVPLRRWCKEQGVTAPKVLHPTFGTVRSWPAGAWMDVYQIDIAELFAAELKEAV